jgi:hypothetical protein
MAVDAVKEEIEPPHLTDMDDPRHRHFAIPAGKKIGSRRDDLIQTGEIRTASLPRYSGRSLNLDQPPFRVGRSAALAPIWPCYWGGSYSPSLARPSPRRSDRFAANAGLRRL